MLKKDMLKKVIAVTGALIITSTSVFVTDVAHAQANKVNMSYIYFGDSSLYSYHVERTQDALGIISPNYFNVDKDGGLEITNAIDRDFVKEMHRKDVEVIPFLSNHWDRDLGRLALENKEELVEEIREVIEEYDLDGINIDLENLTEQDRDEFVDFVKLMRKEVPSDKVVSVCVAPNPFELEKGWQGSYDYEDLARYSDYLVIMAYDESYQGGPVGPVASEGFVEESIKYALEEVPKEKIVLGIPFYGRVWDDEGELEGYGLSIKKVNELVEKYDGEVVYDADKQSAKATIEIKNNDEKPYLFGKKLEAGTYTIWHENDESIKSKLRLVQKYDLRGSATWSLGQEHDSVWNYYDLWLNGQYFEDTQNHWAVDSILNMESKGWMKGTSDVTFSPDKPLTRAQGATILVRALGLEEKNESVNSFNDIDKDHWAREEISIAAEHGIIKGYEDGSFRPEKPITREQMAVMLDRVLSDELKKKEKNLKYNDVDDDRWSYDSISKMTYYDIFKGYEDNSFRPTKNITRAQMAALMDRITSYIED
ncbi:S-layer homology domain-containing protein [Wukongibacter baidiensis]|uniref:S-layer homology domain-containing protein n=1 Tax=Wukongibacter baidiensis TaxID=1723361 RepID=UPI003D7F7DCB